jgi:hypothetical protein
MKELEVFLGTSSGVATDPSTRVRFPFDHMWYQGMMESIRWAANAGDVNGDGFGDVIVQSSGSDAQLMLLTGGPSGLSAAAIAVDLPEVASAFSSAGDVNGDGYGDVVIGTPSGEEPGYILYGSAAGLSSASAPSIATHAHYVASAGDVNGDGYGDVIVSHADYRTFTGNVPNPTVTCVYLGSSAGLVSTAQVCLPMQLSSDTWEGMFVPAGIGDVNGDGYADVALTANSDPGDMWSYRVFVYHGSSIGTRSTPAAVIGVPAEVGNKMKFGDSKVGLDANGDGYWDLAIGAPFTDQAYVFAGGPTGLSTSPATELDDTFDPTLRKYFGTALSGGDHNGDGYEDLGVSAPYVGFSYEGRVHFFHGSPSGVSLQPDMTLVGKPLTQDGAPQLGTELMAAAGGA